MSQAITKIFFAVLLLCGFAFAQGGTATNVRNGASLPAACKNQIFLKDGDGIYWCGNTPNIWEKFSVGGSNTQVQYNDSGSFGGDSGFVWDKTGHSLSITGGTQPNLVFDSVTGRSFISLRRNGAEEFAIYHYTNSDAMAIYDATYGNDALQIGNASNPGLVAAPKQFKTAFFQLSNGIGGTPDVGLSYLATGSMALGNGTNGDFSGTFKTTIINAVTGFRINNAATSGNVLRGNGTNFVNAQLAIGDLTATFSSPLSITTNTLSCPTCVTSSSPGAGIAHFAGSTQAVTSSSVVDADLGGAVGLAHGGTNADLSGTGGSSQVLKQTSAGAAVTVARLACADLSDAASGCSSAAGTGTVTTTGSPANGNLAKFSGSTSVTTADLTGVVVTSGTVATTPGKADVMQTSLYCSDAGSNDTYACNLSPAITAYVTGTHYLFKANTANTGAASINFNSVGALTIKKVAGGITTDLADNDIRAGQWVDLVYDGTNAQMQSTLGNAPAGTGTVTSIATTTPITGGTITSTGTIGCASCVTSSSPGAGVAHFAGSTQAVTSSAVSLTADVTGALPVANGGTNGVNGALSLVVFSPGPTALTNNTTEYMGMESITATTTETTSESPVAVAGTFSNCRVAYRTGAALTSTMSQTFTFRKNAGACGTPGTITMTINSSSTLGPGNSPKASDTTNSCTVAAGDYVAIQKVPANTPTAAKAHINCAFQPN